MSAFDDNRLGVWHTSIFSFLPTDSVTVAGYRKLGITDVFMDPEEVDPTKPRIAGEPPNYMLTRPLMQALMSLAFHPQPYIDGTHSTDGKQIAQRGLAAIKRLAHQGAIQFDVESADDRTLGPTAVALYDEFRAATPMNFALNVAPRKVGFFTTVLKKMAADAHAYLRVQLALGNMEGEADPLEQLLVATQDIGFPIQRVSFTYPAKNQWGKLGLPNVFRGAYDRVIRRGDVYNANLLRELGLA